MSPFHPVRRATLLYPSGPPHDPDRLHLHILLTDSVGNPLNSNINSTLLVGISSVQLGASHDTTCLLRVGDHPFITHDSFVFYADTRIVETAKLVNGISQGAFIARQLMDEGIVDAICDGVLASPHTPRKAQRFYRHYLSLFLGIPP